jgi:diguanylate cyclase
MMNTVVIDLFFGLITMLLGALGALWFCWAHFRRKTLTHSRADAHHAARVLVHLQELATRVAIDVDKHNDQVEEINETLVSAEAPEPKMIVDVVAKLIEANQQMHEKLASTEDKLREQAQAIQVHAAQARTDSLTLLVNRRAFDDELTRRCAEFNRQGHAFSLIMADVDDFKQFNDAHGHLTGDDVLRGVAKVLRRKMREMDLVARYGGEEFAIILPGTCLGDAEKAALRACQGIEKTRFNHDEKELYVTLSFGVAEIRNPEDGMGLVARADKALYAAKEGGRNCVFRHDGETVQRSVLPKKPDPPKADRQAPREPQPATEDNAAQKPPGPDAAAEEQQPDHALPDALHFELELPHRTSFCQQVRHRTAEWKRGGPVFSVILIEVNQYGANDESCSEQWYLSAMQAVSKYITTSAREMDVIGYYAPGCFAMLLPTAELVNAIRVAERLREGFSLANPLGEGAQSRLALSVGVVQVMGKDDSISMLKRAEEAVDAAVRRGGDRAYYHDGKRCAPITAMLETMDYLS